MSSELTIYQTLTEMLTDSMLRFVGVMNTSSSNHAHICSTGVLAVQTVCVLHFVLAEFDLSQDPSIFSRRSGVL